MKTVIWEAKSDLLKENMESNFIRMGKKFHKKAEPLRTTPVGGLIELIRRLSQRQESWEAGRLVSTGRMVYGVRINFKVSGTGYEVRGSG